MRRSSTWRSAAPVILSAVMAVAGGSCTYSPNFADGVVACGTDQSCPKGYSCATDGTCRKHAASGGNPDGGKADGGNGVDAGNSGDAAGKFVGTWTFQNGTFNAACSDGSSDHHALTTADFVVVARGTTSSGVLIEYFCDSGWALGVASSGTTASATAGQPTCTTTTTQAGITTMFTWTVVTFTFNTSDGASGSLSGHLMGPFTATDHTTGTCDITFMGNVTKS